jgi:predicted ArsR family transcriptional regulator
MDPLDAVGDGRLRETLLYVRAQPDPVTAADVARALAVPRTAARWRLERLSSAGLLVAEFDGRKSGGPGSGRPAKLYAPAAETAPLEFPRRRYELLFSQLVRGFSRRRLREAGAEFGAELARAARIRRGRRIAPALEGLCRGLGRLGFHVTLESLSDGRAVLRSATCPLRPLVLVDAGAQALDEGMWRGLVRAALHGKDVARVACRTRDCHGHGPCRIDVTFAAGR